VCLLFFAVNFKLVVFPRLMSILIDFVLHELPEEEASVQTAPFGLTPNPGSPVRPKMASSTSSVDETEDVYRLNLAFMSALFFGSIPQLGITIANTHLLSLAHDDSDCLSSFTELCERGFSVLAIVSISFSLFWIVLQMYRMCLWADRYGWQMDLSMPVYPLRDSQVHRLRVVQQLYKSSTSMVGNVWAPDTNREKRISAAAERMSRASNGGETSSQQSSSSGARSYMAAVTMEHETKKPGWLSLQVGQVVNVLFENPAADEVFVKVLVDGRQGSFPMRCVTMNDCDPGEGVRESDIELAPLTPKVSTAAAGVDSHSEKSQLQLHRAAELQRSREQEKEMAAEAKEKEMQRSASGSLKYKERLTRARFTNSCLPSDKDKQSEENSEIAAYVQSALRSVG
jgi:hypothetical protein